MSEIVAREMFVKNFICEKAVYLQMKADQKAIVNEVHTHEMGSAFRKEMDAWWAEKPAISGVTEWRKAEPVAPWVVKLAQDSERRRAMNIIYGIVKGKPYRKIEQKYREGNEPSEYHIKECCEHYGVNPILIWEAINA